MSNTLNLVTHSADETRQVGRVLGSNARAGDLYLLSGPLGAGKTCLVQGIAFGLGIAEYARSPSFVIVNQYRGRLKVYHIDLYRLEDAQEVQDLGLEEYLEGDGVCAVEWPERGASLFPPEHMWVSLDYGREECDRNIRFEARGARYLKLLHELASAIPAEGL